MNFKELNYTGELKWKAIRLFRDKQIEGMNDNQILTWAIANENLEDPNCPCRMIVDLLQWGKL
jgi:hypothetical protein